MKRLLFACMLMWLSLGTHAKEAAPIAEDPMLEARLMALSEELRCLVCQNESLAGSNADLAVDLRREIREKMQQGMSDQEIIAFLTHRYGDFVLYRPPVKSTTWLLWFGPFLLLLGTAGGVLFFIKRRRQTVNEAPLTQEEAARVDALLHSESKSE